MKKQYIISLSAIALLMACSKDEADMTVVPSEQDYEVRIVAAQSDTRTQFTDEADKLSANWKQGDEIGVSVSVDGTAGSVNVKYTACASGFNTAFDPADAMSAVVKWQDASSKHDFYAYYPYSADNTDVTALTVSVPAIQAQAKAGDLAHLAADFLYARTKSLTMPRDKSVALVFSHPASVLAIDIKTDNGSLVTDEIIVRCTDSSEALAAADAKIDITADSPAIDCSGASVSNEIRLMLGQMAYFSQTDQKIYVQMLPGHGGKTLQVLAVVDDEEVLLAEKTVADAGIPAGATATLSITAEGSDIEKPTLIDLSELGTANCYVINTPDMQYKFRADMRGNGATTPNITPEELNPAAVRLYKEYIPSGYYKGGTRDGWDDDEMNKLVLRESVELKVEDGIPYVYFRTPADDIYSAGNALICATDEDGNIIWSWHIWSTPGWRLGKGDLTLSANDKCDGVVMMDRNLGALSSGPSAASAYDAETEARAAVGLAYQWGRKDPLVYVGVTQLAYNCINGYKQEADGTVKKIRNDGEVYGVWFNSAFTKLTEETAPTVEEAINMTIANPDMRYGCYANQYSNPWAMKKADAQQSDLYKSLWGNSTRSDAVGSGVKTIYDPCPVGYRVPDQNAFAFFTNNGTNVHKNNVVKEENDEIWRLNYDKSKTATSKGTDKLIIDFSSSYGYHFYTASVLSAGQTDADRADKTTTFFPAYQHIFYSADTRLGETGNAFTPREGWMGHHIYIAVNKPEWDNPSGMFFSAESTSNLFNYSGAHHAAAAMPIRCVKE